MQDCYKSILEAFIHAGASNETKVNVVSIHSEYLDAKCRRKIKGLDAILVAQVLAREELKEKLKPSVMHVVNAVLRNLFRDANGSNRIFKKRARLC
jgi:CTP synthase (UTP-ammonia lyase)